MKKKVLIVPDLSGWIVEDMAINIIQALGDEFEFTLQIAEKDEDCPHPIFSWEQDLSGYDLVYLMLPSYVPENMNPLLLPKVVTTFHGGPASEGQADHIQRAGFRDMRMSYVSHQTDDRISKNTFTNRKREKIKINQQIDDKWIRKELLQLSRDRGDSYQIESRPQIITGYQEVRISYSRKGFGFTNLFFTPHGVNMEDYYQDNIREDFVCGYAGWARYLLDAQRDHRRGYWIMEAQKNLGFNLNIAGGIPKYNKKDIKTIRAGFPSDKIKVMAVEHDKMRDFYSGISCYLVPDKFAGGPMPVLEAGSMGIPVVCTDAGLCGDIIEDGVHGRVVSTYAEFENAIAWMRDHPAKRKQMGLNLQEYIRKNRTWEAVAPYWSKFLKGVNNRNRNGGQ